MGGFKGLELEGLNAGKQIVKSAQCMMPKTNCTPKTSGHKTGREISHNIGVPGLIHKHAPQPPAISAGNKMSGTNL